jgi:hypothetical protein
LSFQPTASSGELARRGLWFDAAVLGINLLFLGPLTDLVKRSQGFHPLFGVLLLAAVVLHAVGAGLKRRPLRARLMAVNAPMSGGAVLLFLVLFVMHLGLFTACMVAGAEMLRAVVPISGPLPGWLRVCAIIVIAVGSLAPTTLAVAALFPARKPEPPMGPTIREAWADILLCASCVIILAWWNGVFVEVLAGAQAFHWLMRVFLVVLVTVPFSIFYLAPRILFLMEDYRRPQTWIGVFLVMLPLAARLVWR